MENLLLDSPHFQSLSEEVKQRLSILSRVADILELDDTSFSSYANAITHLSSSSLSIKRSLTRLEGAESALRAHLARATLEERLISRWIESLEVEQNEESASALERRKDALLKKAKEYQKELDLLKKEMPDEPTVTVTELAAQQERIRKKEQEVKAKKAKIKAFQGLPPNLDLARMELRNARNEQMKLIQLRERLLGRMADGVS